MDTAASSSSVPCLGLSTSADHFHRDHRLDDDLPLALPAKGIIVRRGYVASRGRALLFCWEKNLASLMNNFFRFVIVVSGLSIFAAPGEAKRPKQDQLPEIPNELQRGGPPPPNDTALFLAGMPLPRNSPLAPLTNDPAYLDHSAFFEKAFAKLNTRQLAKIHVWQEAYMPESKETIPVAYYMFSGPDFLYVDQFFPKASVYILCGKESMGPPPDPLRIANLSGAFYNLENAMNSSLRYSFFITKDMKVDLQQQQLNGTLPILYVFLARAGKTITSVAYGALNGNGAFQESAPGKRGGSIPGVRINYTDNQSGDSQ